MYIGNCCWGYHQSLFCWRNSQFLVATKFVGLFHSLFCRKALRSSEDKCQPFPPQKCGISKWWAQGKAWMVVSPVHWTLFFWRKNFNRCRATPFDKQINPPNDSRRERKKSSYRLRSWRIPTIPSKIKNMDSFKLSVSGCPDLFFLFELSGPGLSQEIADEDPMEVLNGVGTQARVQQAAARQSIPFGVKSQEVWWFGFPSKEPSCLTVLRWRIPVFQNFFKNHWLGVFQILYVLVSFIWPSKNSPGSPHLVSENQWCCGVANACSRRGPSLKAVFHVFLWSGWSDARPKPSHCDSCQAPES